MPKLIRIIKFNEKISICAILYFLCRVVFFRIYLSMGDRDSSGAGESMQNDLAHLTESARLHMDGFAGVRTEKLRLYRHVDDTKNAFF